MKELAYSVKYRGRNHKLFPYFNRILAVMELQDEENIFDSDKIRTACGLIVEGVPSAGLYSAAIDTILGKREKPEKDEPPVFSFLQDFDLIEAAFLQTYGIKLSDEADKMHWQSFLALFNGLPDGTRFSQIVDIRTRPMPKPTKENAEYRAALLKMKRLYAVKENKETAQQRLNKQLSALFDVMMAKAGEP